MAKQLSLFKGQNLNVNRAFKECLVHVVSKSGMSRAEFLDQMNAIADRSGIRLMKGKGSGLTMATFEKWLNVDQSQYSPPLAAITVICEAGNTLDPINVFARALGVEVVDEQRLKTLLWADACLDERNARKRKRKLEADL